jgi:hypothetical protein
MIGALAIRDRFDDFTVGFRTLSHTCGELASLSPVPIFGSPIQNSNKSDYSWWHIPIALNVPGPWHKRQLMHCTVHLVTPNIVGPPIDLSWRSPDAMATRNTMSLDHRATALVPVVARRESIDGVTIITNETYFREKKAVWNLNPRIYAWKLELRSGKKRWESPHYYVLKVPPKGQSNGHFTLEVRHDEPA